MQNKNKVEKSYRAEEIENKVYFDIIIVKTTIHRKTIDNQQ